MKRKYAFRPKHKSNNIIIGVIYPMATLAIYQLISTAGNVETAPFLSGPLSFRFCV